MVLYLVSQGDRRQGHELMWERAGFVLSDLFIDDDYISMLQRNGNKKLRRFFISKNEKSENQTIKDGIKVELRLPQRILLSDFPADQRAHGQKEQPWGKERSRSQDEWKNIGSCCIVQHSWKNMTTIIYLLHFYCCQDK